MKGSSRLKAMDERTSHVTEWKATKRTNESSEWTNERTNKVTYERRNKADNRTSETPAKQTENGLTARANARKPGNSTNGWIHLSLFKTNKSNASLVHNIEKYFWAALNKISRNWFDNAIEKKKLENGRLNVYYLFTTIRYRIEW